MNRDSTHPPAGRRAPVVLLCAVADMTLVERDALGLEALGLDVEVHNLDQHPREMTQADQLLAVYLSAHSLAVRTRVQLHSWLQVARPAIGITLDETLHQADEDSLSLRRLLSRIDVAEGDFLRGLYSALLEELDVTGWNRADAVGDETRFLPGSLIVSGARRELVIPADFRGLVTVGRSATCQICVDSTFASRLHGCLRTDQGLYLYRDMSSNGTLLYDGHEEFIIQDEESPLPETGELRIGDIALRFSINAV